ncbi:unnamed protein product, partial [Chrysoparadoxa australica]
FIGGNTRSSDLYLFRWLRNNKNGVPVFAEPIAIKEFFTSNGSILQTSDGIIHGLWLDRDTVVHTIFDKDLYKFVIKGKVMLPELPSTPNSISTFINNDGSIDLLLELRGHRIPGKYENQNASSENWRPYDEAGIASTSISYTYLYSLRFPKLLDGEAVLIQQATPTNREVMYGMRNTTPVNLGKGHEQELITGSHLGVLPYYERTEKNSLSFSTRRYVVGQDGNLLRHPSVSATVVAYPSSNGNISNIVVGGEGAVYFYQFTGQFTPEGSPIFKDPVSALQENAYLYGGTLPVPSSIDWDGDNVIDLIVGNSEGFVLFFKNIGSNDNPSFLPGERVLAGGSVIQIQGGYSGSVQGVAEARWGYLSPTAIDWNEDGLPDIIMGDITGNYSIYINRGTKTKPVLEAAMSIFCDGLELHGMWRSRAAVGRLGNRMALANIDGDDEFHLFWKIEE